MTKKLNYIHTCDDCPWFTKMMLATNNYTGYSRYTIQCQHPNRDSNNLVDNQVFEGLHTHEPDEGCPLTEVSQEELDFADQPFHSFDVKVGLEEVTTQATITVMTKMLEDPACREKMEELLDVHKEELKTEIIGDLINHISEVEHAVMTRNVGQWAEKEIAQIKHEGVLDIFSSYDNARAEVLKEVLVVCARKPAPEPKIFVMTDDDDDDDDDIPF